MTVYTVCILPGEGKLTAVRDRRKQKYFGPVARNKHWPRFLSNIYRGGRINRGASVYRGALVFSVITEMRIAMINTRRNVARFFERVIVDARQQIA